MFSKNIYSQKHLAHRLRNKPHFISALVVTAVFGAIGLYTILQSYAAVGDTYTSNVMVNIPGNGSACTWSCFKPEVTQVSIYIVPRSCSTVSEDVQDWCSDITSADLMSCNTYDVQSASQTINGGTMTFQTYGPSAAQGTGQYHYNLYATAGGSCGSTYSHSSAGTPNSTVYIGPHPSCGTTLGEDCPVDDGGGGSGGSGGRGEDSGNEGSGGGGTGSGSGSSGSGSGTTGNGKGSGNGSGSSINPINSNSSGGSGPIAQQQSSDSNAVPSTSKQGNTDKQPNIIPSPFYDGKQYEPGSLEDTFGVVTIGDKAVSKFWVYISLGAVIIIASGIGGYMWWKKHKRIKT